jgi:myxalamid-type polyketide synthase MxaE and MxaD
VDGGEAMSAFPQQPSVAVVGLSCRLPGAITTPDQLWADLMDGRDLVTDHAQDHPRADILPAAILADDGQAFDAAHFGISPTELEAMDPQQRLLLELAAEAFEDAGISPADWRGHRVGVWVGSSCLDQALLRLGPGQGGTMLDTAGAIPSMMANRVSRHRLFDWRGPSEVVDTACSASLVAVHRARQALAVGEVDLAVAAGVNTLRLDTHTRMFATSRALAPDGRCRPFDRQAQGFVRGEGGAVVVLQRQEDAEACGVRPRAVLVGSGTGSDGAGSPLGAPNKDGQAGLLSFVYTWSGVDPHHVDYLETHGTGTPAGDNVESRAAGDELAQGRAQERPLLLGSIKSNLGHLEGAAGIVSLAKVVLSLEHGQIPPTIHHRDPLPILRRRGLEVVAEPRPWPATDRPRMAAVQAFGFGGTNAHVILTQAAPTAAVDEEPLDGDVVVPLSASGLDALRTTARRWAAAVEGHPSLGAVAATAAHRRDPYTGARAAAVAGSPGQAARAFKAAAEHRTDLALVGPRVPTSKRPRVVFAFDGHGAHPAGDGDLAEREPVFAAALADTRHAVDSYAGGPLREGLERWQPEQWAWQVAAAALLTSWGITPDVVVGHSLGEVAAATVAGVLSIQDAARLVVERSRLLAQTAPAGGLLATQLSAEQARAAITDHPRMGVAALNAPQASVLSGSHADLDAVAARLDADRHWFKRVPQAPPAHSPLMDDAAAALPGLLAGIEVRPGGVALHSTATGGRLSGSQMGPAYWGRQLRAPVLLHQVVDSLARDGEIVVVEIGARPVLSGALAATLARAQGRYEVDPPLVSVATNGPEHTDMLTALAGLFTFGLDPVWPIKRAPAVRLPLRAWTHSAPAPAAASAAPASALAGLPPQDVRAAITDQVLALTSQMVPGPAAGPDTAWAELGLESLFLTHLHRALVRALPELARLPVEAVHGSRTPAGLVDAALAHWGHPHLSNA